jgi:hypothetical protein
VSRPAPPYCSGIAMPIKPSSAIRGPALWEAVLAIDVGGPRQHFVPRKLGGGPLGHQLLVTETEIHDSSRSLAREDGGSHSDRLAILIDTIAQ